MESDLNNANIDKDCINTKPIRDQITNKEQPRGESDTVKSQTGAKHKR